MFSFSDWKKGKVQVFSFYRWNREKETEKEKKYIFDFFRHKKMANDDWAAAVDLQEGIRNVEVAEDAEEPTKGEQSFLCKGMAMKNLFFDQKNHF